MFNLTDDRKHALAALGQGLSQLSAGQPVNLQPAMKAMQDRRTRSDMKRVMGESGVLSQFTPQQQAILAQMEPKAAQQVIASVLFREPAAPAKGVVVNGQLVNPQTGGVIGDYRTPEGPEAPVVREVTLEDGSEALVQWNPETQAWDAAKIPEGGTGAQPRNKLTESQSKITLFQSLQDETAPVLNRIEEQYDPANIGDAAARATPLAGNFFQSTEGQVYNAAAAQWAEGALRIATGAAATPEEIERIRKTYFAQPGDTPATIKFKSDLRDSYTRAINRSLGEQGVSGEIPLPDEFAKGFIQETPLTETDGLPDFVNMSDQELDAWIKANGG